MCPRAPYKHQWSTHHTGETTVSKEEWAGRNNSQRWATGECGKHHAGPSQAKRAFRCPHLPAKKKTEVQPTGTPAPGDCGGERAVRKELCRRLATHSAAGGVEKECCCSFLLTNTNIPTQVMAEDRMILSDHSSNGKELRLWVGEARTSFHNKTRGMRAPKQEYLDKADVGSHLFPPWRRIFAEIQASPVNSLPVIHGNSLI